MKAVSVTIMTVALLFALTPPAHLLADEAEATGRNTRVSVEAGAQYADTDGDRSFIYPFSPMDSNPLFFLDLFTIAPGGKSFELEGAFTDDQDWSAGARYNHGAAFQFGVRAQEFFHALPHDTFPPDFETPAPGFDSVHTEYDDDDPGREYHSGIREFTGDFKVRFPSYPAHIRGDARVYRREGPQQMKYFFRTCSTHICHVNSKTRDVETETQEYNIGFDGHFGPVDVVYNRNFLLFDDKAPDPVDFYGDFILGRPVAGEYPHHINPETESWYDEIKLNTNLTNRAALVLHYLGGKSENSDSDISEGNRHFTADVSYVMSRQHFFSARYLYDRGEVDDIGEEVAAIRERIGDAVAPGKSENLGELTWRWTPRPGAQMHAHVRYTDVQRDDTEESGLPESSTGWTADVDGKLNISSGLALEAELARDWMGDPAFATDFTDRWRFMLGALWSPADSFSLLAKYTGFTGENDDEAALQRAYDDPVAPPESQKRESDGHNLFAAATWTPAESLTFVLSYNYSVNDIEQDQFLGTASEADRAFLSEASPFESLYQVGNLKAVWSPAKRLTLSLGGMVIDGEESWEPEVAGRPDLTEGLDDIARSEFVKYMLDAEIEYGLGEGLDLVVAGYYADYDDKVDDLRDGSGGGVLATVRKRW